ncbi:neuraminidase-like domain-containing protein, partial [Pseudomonas sp.]|uniref:Tc toxin subunit A-related protein n=1 Tax=Pseudomonas sp. TaxID=306 RepID=UPI002896B956
MNELTSPAAGTTPAERNDAATYMRLFPDDQTRCAPGALMANNSRLAYLVHLKELIQAFEVRAKISAPITLLKRRPDLLALTLDDKNSRKILPKVRLALGLLESRAKEALTAKQTLQPMVAKGLYNANVPYHAAWESIKATLAAKNMPLWDVLSSAHATYPSFTFDNLTQAAQRSATSLSNGFAPQLQAVLLSENGQDSLALTSVDTTRKMAKALGLTRRELRQLLAVNAVGEGKTAVNRSAHVSSAAVPSSAVHGAAFINNGATPLSLTEPQPAQPSAKKTVVITGLTNAHLDRMQRILRVQRALGLNAAECDSLVMAALRAEGQQTDYHLTGNTLRALGMFRHLQQKYRVTPWQYAAFLDAISPYATDRQVSFYDQLFAPANGDDANPAAPVLCLDDSEFDPLATSASDGLTIKQLCLALNVDNAFLRVILGWVTSAQGLAKPTRSLAVVSACYRIVALARLFGTSTQQGLCLLELLMEEQPVYRQQLAGKPSLLGEAGKADIVDVIAGVAHAMEWVQQQGLDTQRLARVLSQQAPYTSRAWETVFKPGLAQSPDALHLALRTALGLNADNLVEPLLRWAKVDAKAFADRIEAIAQQSAQGATPLSCFTASDYLQWSTLQRLSDLVKLFKLSATMLQQVSLNPGWFTLEGKKKNTWRPLDLTTVYQLSRYKALLARLAQGHGEPDVLHYLAEFDTQTNGPLQGSRVDKAWSELERLLDQPSGALSALAGIAPPSTLGELDRLLRLLEQANKHRLAVDTLLELGALPKAKEYGAFEQAAVALRKGCSNKQRKALDAQLSLAWRDALMQWMIVNWAPKEAARSWISSPQTLADYLLMDLQVSHEPLTTRTLSATASLQRYLHQIHSNLENGYRNSKISEEEREEWETFSSSYERWKLRKDAHNEPQNFIDPTRRHRKTTAFKDLETALAQGKCTADDVQIAMLGYLSSFETVSNIQPISVYADGTSPLTDTYHFIGKTNVEPTEYYWRTLDMKQLDKQRAPSMLAWSEWEKITLTVSGQMAVTPLPKTLVYVKGQGTAEEEAAKKEQFLVDNATEQSLLANDSREHIDLVRPVVIAGRRYAVWVERDTTAIIGEDSKPSPYYALRVCFSYQQTDGMWTPANELICLDGHDDQGAFTPIAKNDTQANGTSSSNNYLKTKDFKPGLMVMVNIEGDRLDDPWLTVLLFDASPSAKKDATSFIVMKDLLLLENRSLDIGNEEKTIQSKLATNWLKLFDDPRTVQHPYKGPSIDLEPKADTKKQHTWSRTTPESKLGKKYGIQPIGKIDFTAQISTDQKQIKIWADPQNIWLPRTLFALKPFIVNEKGYGNIATIAIEVRETNNNEDYELLVSATHISKDAYKLIRLYLELPSQNDLLTKDDMLFKEHFAQQKFSVTIKKNAFEKLKNSKEIYCPTTASYGENRSEWPTAQLTPISIQRPSQVKTRSTITPHNASHPTWTLPNQDSQQLETPVLSQLKTLASAKLPLFNALKKALLKTRYTTLSEYNSQLGITEGTNDQSRLAYGEAITMARTSNNSKAADAITAFIDKEAEEIKLADSTLPDDLLKAAVRLRHYHPESCLRILLYLGPEHTMVFEDVLLKNDLSQVLCQYPFNRDITEYTIKLEAFDEAIDDEPLASVEEVYTLVSKEDDAVPSVFIRRNDQQALYLDLAEANEKADTKDKLSVQSLRLNTLFGKQLVALASQSVEQALSWKAQHLPEPPLEPGSSGTTVDFRSANGLYFWELFFHVPFLLAWLQRQNREYSQAWRCCTRYLFDPYRTWVPEGDRPPKHWLSQALLDDVGYAVAAQSNDPDLLAYAEPERYQKALHLFVVGNWQRQGDDQYRLLTLDSLVEAALCYDKALRLIGVLPENLSSAPAQPPSLDDARSSAFTPPLNNKLVELRNLLRNRLFNLRHGLTLDGKPASIMLDPDVIDRLALGHGSADQDQSSKASKARVVPPLRYAEVRKCAGEAVQQLIGMGQTLLGYYQTEATQQLELLSKRNLIKLLDFPYQLQEQALELAQRERETVLTAKEMAHHRLHHYQQLKDDVRIDNLSLAGIGLGTASYATRIAAIPLYAVAAKAAVVPTIFGMACGGHSPNECFESVANAIEAAAETIETTSNSMFQLADYFLRQAQWNYEIEQAGHELNILDKQLRERDVHIKAARIALQETNATRQAHQAEYEVMTSVFPNRTTYLWLIERLSEIYNSAYDATLSLCLMAEACLQYELADFKTTWIKPGAWLDNWRGMLAGEALIRDLMLMDVAAVRDNHRPLIVHANVSLRKIKGWSQDQLKEHIEKGTIYFELAPHHFDAHFPGHYLRRIEDLDVEFIKYNRMASGLHTVSAMLRQTSSTVLLEPNVEAMALLYAGKREGHDAIKTNLRVDQYMAISAASRPPLPYDVLPAMTDKSRYNVFEGTGLISSYTLTFPTDAACHPGLYNDKGTFIVEDITVKLIISAYQGEVAFCDAVKRELNEFNKTEAARKTADKLAKARKAEQDANASSAQAQTDASADVLKAPEAAAELSKATAALTEAQTAAKKAKAAREKAEQATTVEGLDNAVAEAKHAAQEAKDAADKAAAARKAAEDLATQRRTNALAKARKAEQDANASSAQA